ncbi:MAG: sulfite oxidase [Acidobacteria bacterium]|nr:sulfite oxidase [Acidobacteriota bacterium]MBI3425786.1 sulfite oxidase [Acidobacteriota bacterium]
MKKQSRRAAARRDFLIGAAQTGAALGLSQLLPGAAFAQGATFKGKDSRLIVRSARPEDLETPVSLLNSYLTPNELFYVRHHAYAATVSEKDWKLTIDGEVDKPYTLTLDELKKFPRATVTVTLECAGNGRAFYEPPVAGIQWERGAVGTARWTGVRLADVLKRAGVKTTGKYVALDGADKAVGKQPEFIRNLPLEKAMHVDTILAYEMNGQPLPVLHGFPLRAVASGWEGAYAVKWLQHIAVIPQEHEGFFVKTAYRYPNRRVAPGEAVAPQDMEPVKGLFVKSFLNAPLDGTKQKAGPVRVSGFAWAGESFITKVEVSMDNGSTWQLAKLGKEREKYAWQSFEHTFNITKPGSYLLMARATDDKGNMQPVAPQWNPSGYLWNVIDKVRINVEA